MRLKCSATLIAALLMAISVFIGNVSHTEFKSQMRKRKLKKVERAIVDDLGLDDTITDTGSSDV